MTTPPAAPDQPGIHQQRREHHPHRLRAPSETAQPAADRLHRPSHRGSRRPGTSAGRLRGQRGTDHRHHIRPAQQGTHRQQNMRLPARAAPGPPRPHRPAAAQHPRPGPPPRPQTAPATRARQLSPDKPALDPGGIYPYREHSASARDTALPDALGQERCREGLRMPSSARRRRPPAPHRHRHTPEIRQHPQCPETAPNISIPNAAQHARQQEPQADGNVPDARAGQAAGSRVPAAMRSTSARTAGTGQRSSPWPSSLSAADDG
jgi:hypothetical protein